MPPAPPPAPLLRVPVPVFLRHYWHVLWRAMALALVYALSRVSLDALTVLAAGVVFVMLGQEDALCSQTLSCLSAFTGLLLVLGGHDGQHHNLAFASWVYFLGLVSMFAALALARAKEVVFAKLVEQNRADSFLSHALKQKFAAVGAALEQVLGAAALLPPPSTPTTLAASPPLSPRSVGVVSRARGNAERLELLRMAMIECRMGHGQCHATALFRQMESGQTRPPGKRTLENLVDQVRGTPAACELLVPNSTMIAPSARGVFLELDWEVFHLVLTDLARRRYKLRRLFCDGGGDGDERRVCLLMDRAVVMGSHSLPLQRLMVEINARVDDNAVIVTLPLTGWVTLGENSSLVERQHGREEAEEQEETQRAARYEAHMREDCDEDKNVTALAKLSFALVDDNALIRKSLARILHVHVGVPQDRIWTCGATAKDCQAFAQRICDDNVDVAIFDQNLEFEDDSPDGGEVSITGSDLARQAKELGFTGCLLLHSSDAQSAAILSEGVFHGAIEKTANTAEFVAALRRAWMDFTSLGGLS